MRPGIPLDGCSDGFEHDGEYGCNPILPETACPAGLMAVPGESACRPVMPCGSGRWGDLPVDPGTEYVDASYAGGGSDGTSDKPWTRVRDAYQAAAPGALIALAEGRYLENVVFKYKPVRLWGVCPEKVSIEGPGPTGAIDIGPGSDGTNIGGIAVTSAAFGITISGAANVTLDRVWIRNTGKAAIWTLATSPPTSVQVRGALLEGGHDYGIFVSGSQLTLIESVIRNTLATSSDQRFGGGLRAEMACRNGSCDRTTRPIVAIEGLLIENNHTDGVSVLGADLTLSASVVRDTKPEPATQAGGTGVVVQLACGSFGCLAEEPSHATITGCVVENNHNVGTFVSGSEADIASTVVSGTQPQAFDNRQGTGILMQTSCTLVGCDPNAASRGIVRTSLIEDNHTGGILVMGSKAEIENSVARRTAPQPSDLRQGLGIAAQVMCDPFKNCDPTRGSNLKVSGCLVEDNHDAGIAIMFSEAHLSSSLIRRTAPRQVDGTYGDGLVFRGFSGESVTVVSNMTIVDSARAGLASFAARTSLESTAISCAAFELVGQDIGSARHYFEDLGGNQCGCPSAANACKSVSAGLEPPEAAP